MWRMLKAEFSYNKYWLMVSYSVFVLFFSVFYIITVVPLFDTRSMDLKPIHVPMMMVLASFISTLIMSAGKTIGKRDYFHMTLPVSAYKIGAVRVLFALCVWFSLVSLFWVPFALFTDRFIDSSAYVSFFYIMGIFLLFNAAWMIHIDVHKSAKKRKLFGVYDKDFVYTITTVSILVTWLFLFSIQSGFIFGWFEPFRLSVRPLVNSPRVITLFNMLGLVLSYLSVVVFVRRGSFLE